MSISIFLADDHAVLRDGLKSLLETNNDIKVVGEAANGRDAVFQATKICPDVVIVDIAMPELNGIDVTRRIKEACPSTRIVVLSIYSTNEHIFQALHAGADGYVLKESAGAEVLAAIRDVHAGRRYMCKKILERERDIDTYLQNRNNNTQAQSPLNRLSPRERQILQYVVEGKSSSQISDIVGLSAKTVDTYRSRLMRKLGASDRTGLIKIAIQLGLTTME
ncbi:MAG: response regulator transcription factor [Nitrospirae bacterium]|nr:response regulator transcription factor [Nitrospirota bacterium]